MLRSVVLLRLCAFAGVGLIGACATPVAPLGQEVVVRHYTPSEITVPGRSVGQFQAAGGCIFFHLASPRPPIAALFPPGTRLSDDRQSIVLPNGQSIPFGQQITISAERPPNTPNVDQSCGPRPIQVLNLIREE